MPEHVMRKSGVHGYEGAWLRRWTQRGSGFELQAHHSNRNAECSTKISLQEDGHQLLKGSTGSMKPKGKILSGCLDLTPILDLNKRPPTVADIGDSIDREEGEETSSSATKSMDVKDFLSDNNNLFKEGKRKGLDPETTNSRSNVKRLKANASDDYTGNETKSMVVVKGPSGEKVSYFFHRILKCEFKKPFPSKIKKLNMGGGEEDKENFMLHLCGKKAAATHVQGGRQEVNRKGTYLEKQFPSVGAMALMGKAARRIKPGVVF